MSEPKARHFRWLPNALSAARIPLAGLMYGAAMSGRWQAAFWLLVTALVTDFFDGLAAKKLRAESTLGGHIDRVADFCLAFGGAAALVQKTAMLPEWLLAAGFAWGLFIAYVKFLTPPEGRLSRVTSVFSLASLFAVWIYNAWGFLTQAYGWSWWYVVVTVATLLGAARLKRHRLRSWFGWIIPAVATRLGRTR